MNKHRNLYDFPGISFSIRDTQDEIPRPTISTEGEWEIQTPSSSDVIGTILRCEDLDVVYFLINEVLRTEFLAQIPELKFFEFILKYEEFFDSYPRYKKRFESLYSVYYKDIKEELVKFLFSLQELIATLPFFRQLVIDFIVLIPNNNPNFQKNNRFVYKEYIPKQNVKSNNLLKFILAIIIIIDIILFYLFFMN